MCWPTPSWTRCWARRLWGTSASTSPDSDPAYAGADSLALARHVAELVRAAGWQVGNIDATILCQRPKLAPPHPRHAPEPGRRLRPAVAAVSVKATTEEHLGFTGEGLGIAAHAVALDPASVTGVNSNELEFHHRQFPNL